MAPGREEIDQPRVAVCRGQPPAFQLQLVIEAFVVRSLPFLGHFQRSLLGVGSIHHTIVQT
jgi:hypothetical protein